MLLAGALDIGRQEGLQQQAAYLTHAYRVAQSAAQSHEKDLMWA